MQKTVVCQQCGAENPATYNFCGSCGSRLEGAAAEVITGSGPVRVDVPSDASPAVFLSDPAYARAERRQLTVMFCDLVGSTALSMRLDPEDLREVVQEYQKVCADVIERYGGYVAQYLGDGLLVYFGYPAAHEDEAERAVRAGLGIIRGIEKLSRLFEQERAVDMAVRVGVHTGLVVVGEMGSGARRERLAMGDTPNLAARLQSMARPNTLVVSSATYRLVAGVFEFEDLGAQSLKGVARQESVYRVIGERQASSPLDMLFSGGHASPIGREREVQTLLDRWKRVEEGEGQVVALCGEAGIGKSHLIQVFRQRLAGTPHNRLECRCSPYFRKSPFYSFVDLLQRVLNFYPGQPVEEQLDMLEFVLERNSFSDPEMLPLFAALLSLPLDGRAAPLGYSPLVQRVKTDAALMQLVANASEERPLVFIVEDLYWVDPSTLGLLGRLVERIPAWRIFMLLTYRPTFKAPWEPAEHLATLTLSRLDREQVRRIIAEVAREKTVPPAVAEQIVLMADGIPLFVRELTKMVLESGMLEERGDPSDDPFGRPGGSPSLSIPATLQDSLMARLDRLAPVKEVAQLCATLGREFTYELLAAVSHVNETALQAALTRLVDAGILYAEGRPPKAKYLFEHALIQEAAYESLLKSQRPWYHRRIADELENRFPDVVASKPELAAYHYTHAGMSDKAARYWNEAGQRSLSLSADVEAADHFSKGLVLLDPLPDTPERLRMKLDMQVGLGSALLQRKGYTHLDVKAAYERARDLCTRVEDAPERVAAVLRGLWTHYTALGDHRTAEDLAKQLSVQAKHAGVDALIFEAKKTVASTLCWRGEVTTARALLEQAIAEHESVQHEDPSSLLTEHPTVSCLSYLCNVLWYLGYPDQAVERASQALELARELEHPFSLAYALGFNSVLYAHLGDRKTTGARAEAVLEVSRQYGFSFWSGVGSILYAWSQIEDDPEAGLRSMRQGLETFREAGVQVWTPHPMALLAHELGRRGLPEEGLQRVDEALKTAQVNRERFYLPELHRLRGELLLALDPEHDAEAAECFTAAHDLARRQKARVLELRSLVSRVRNQLDGEEREQTRRMLKATYHGFSEGLHTPDLLKARALL